MSIGSGRSARTTTDHDRILQRIRCSGIRGHKKAHILAAVRRDLLLKSDGLLVHALKMNNHLQLSNRSAPHR